MTYIDLLNIFWCQLLSIEKNGSPRHSWSKKETKHIFNYCPSICNYFQSMPHMLSRSLERQIDPSSDYCPSSQVQPQHKQNLNQTDFFYLYHVITFMNIPLFLTLLLVTHFFTLYHPLFVL